MQYLFSFYSAPGLFPLRALAGRLPARLFMVGSAGGAVAVARAGSVLQGQFGFFMHIPPFFSGRAPSRAASRGTSSARAAAPAPQSSSRLPKPYKTPTPSTPAAWAPDISSARSPTMTADAGCRRAERIQHIAYDLGLGGAAAVHLAAADKGKAVQKAVLLQNLFCVHIHLARRDGQRPPLPRQARIRPDMPG